MRLSLKNKKFVIILFVIHLAFVALNYFYTLFHGGDANRYWFQNVAYPNNYWFEYLGIGTELMLFINYPFAVLLNLPIWFGFFMYGLIGFLGIWQLIRLCQAWVGNELRLFGINIIPLFFFLPNLHFWTATLGKEPLCFLALATIFLELFKEKYKSFALWFSFAFIFFLRPHLAIMLLFSVGVVLLIVKNWKPIVKFAFGLGIAIVLSIGYLLFLELSQIKSLHWGRLVRFNEGSILSFQDSGSYVPMLEYSYPMKLFSFYFRPLFVDAQNLFQWVLSVENAFLLLIHLFALYLFVRYWKSLKTDTLFKIVLVFALVAGILYVQRYANLGIFARTKVMIQPFLMVAFFHLLVIFKKTGKIKWIQ